MELTCAHSKNGRATNSRSNTVDLRQTDVVIDLADLIDLDICAGISLAKDRIAWKKNRPSKRC